MGWRRLQVVCLFGMLFEFTDMGNYRYSLLISKNVQIIRRRLNRFCIFIFTVFIVAVTATIFILSKNGEKLLNKS
jgi:hypothetical protein